MDRTIDTVFLRKMMLPPRSSAEASNVFCHLHPILTGAYLLLILQWKNIGNKGDLTNWPTR